MVRTVVSYTGIIFYNLFRSSICSHELAKGIFMLPYGTNLETRVVGKTLPYRWRHAIKVCAELGKALRKGERTAISCNDCGNKNLTRYPANFFFQFVSQKKKTCMIGYYKIRALVHTPLCRSTELRRK